MEMLPVIEQARKPARLETCPRCAGIGREGRGLERRPCGCCSGTGKVRFVEAPPAEYIATQGTAIVDHGGPLAEFVEGLLSWQLAGESIIVWAGPKAVAVLSAGAGGETVVRWL